ncbi:T9SS type B sorting domain-containing protein [Hymenobacter terricola]|uniref:T9SS type B sorting domain-containing protein n=1 Tax=Hymenobacter terricola TaxID=2819236 RepID=UPI001CF2FB5F|nr:gliding motility-associated C-terminal domain-containing protein [Hymenobacter terricola]
MKYLPSLALWGWLLAAGASAALGQNLVINPGFEQYTRCLDSTTQATTGASNLDYVLSGFRLGTGAPGWLSPTALSAGHVIACNALPEVRRYGRRYNGWYLPRTGGGYIMLTTYGGDLGHSYAQGQLSQPLRAGCTYRVSAWVRVSFPAEIPSPPTSSDNLGVYFSPARFGNSSARVLTGYQPQAQLLAPGQTLTDTLHYTYLSRTFVAQGGEQYFTLGNFQPDAATTVRRLRSYGVNPGYPNAQYSIDDVAVEAVLPAGLALELGPDQWLGTCPGAGPATLTAQAGFQGYRWSTGQTTASIQVSQPGRYVVTADFGCGLVKDSVEVRRYDPRLTPLLAPPPALCAGQSLTLTAAPGLQGYQWADGPTGPARAVSQPGRYRLLARTADGCPVRDSVDVALLPPPLVPAGFPTDTLVCAQEPWRLALPPPPAGVSYDWSTGATGPALFVPAGVGGAFTLTVRTRCQAVAATVRVRPQDCAPLLNIPNIVTPNGDGRNDRFRVLAPSPRTLRLQVFSRWGQLLFEAADYQGQWPADATVAAGSYYYFLVDTTYGRRYRTPD